MIPKGSSELLSKPNSTPNLVLGSIKKLSTNFTPDRNIAKPLNMSSVKPKRMSSKKVQGLSMKKNKEEIKSKLKEKRNKDRNRLEDNRRNDRKKRRKG